MSTSENSIRADLEAAVKAHAEPPEVETDVEAIDTSAESVETTAQERARDDQGRFVAKEVSSGAATEGERPRTKVEPVQGDSSPERASAPVQGQPANAPNESGGLATAAALAPPNGWSAEAKAKWHELSPEIMAAVQKREQDIAKFTSTRDEHASFGKEIYQTVQPYLATINAEGGTPATAIKALLNTAYVLRTGSQEHKRALLLNTAKQFGIDLGTAAAKPGQQPTTTAPELAALQNEVAELRGLLRQRDEAVDRQLQTEVQTELEAFAADPRNAHYSEVKAYMAALLRDGLAKNLKDAYDQAVEAHPTVRATLQAQRRAEEEQKRRVEAKAKAEAAKRKNVSITGGPGNTAAAAAPGGRSIRDELEAAMAASSGVV